MKLNLTIKKLIFAEHGENETVTNHVTMEDINIDTEISVGELISLLSTTQDKVIVGRSPAINKDEIINTVKTVPKYKGTPIVVMAGDKEVAFPSPVQIMLRAMEIAKEEAAKKGEEAEATEEELDAICRACGKCSDRVSKVQKTADDEFNDIIMETICIDSETVTRDYINMHKNLIDKITNSKISWDKLTFPGFVSLYNNIGSKRRSIIEIINQAVDVSTKYQALLRSKVTK